MCDIKPHEVMLICLLNYLQHTCNSCLVQTQFKPSELNAQCNRPTSFPKASNCISELQN